jgi:hypothetical protein
MGRRDRPVYACTTATHRDALASVEAAARAFQAAGCGDPIPIGEPCAIPFAHGLHLDCTEQHLCEAGN